ncbi:DUF5325 family protein [Gracilibacillus sp. YIM 98692]|uniref:DUF5325 family protein n=1 Tax=Gracilibacillus sp. YIM 98692 TaxID=2663532 RepID=UPI0013D21BC2|nr:DUF5325 family protein [Gracilibacillus sp. YIM 98692]
MKNIQLTKLLLAILVILSFSGAGVAIAFRNIWFILLAILLGFFIMGYGIAQKRKES